MSKSIFNEQELEAMRGYFNQQLELAEQKVQEIKTILQKIGKGSSPGISIDSKTSLQNSTGKKRAKTGTKTIMGRPKKKPGRKPNNSIAGKALPKTKELAQTDSVLSSSSPKDMKSNSVIKNKPGKSKSAKPSVIKKKRNVIKNGSSPEM